MTWIAAKEERGRWRGRAGGVRKKEEQGCEREKRSGGGGVEVNL